MPKGWKALSLEDITSYIIGGDWGIDVKEDGFEKVHVIRGTDYKAWDSIRAENSAVRYVKASSVEKRELKEGDMVLEVSGGGPDQPVGRVIIIDIRALESIDGKLGFSNFFRLIRIAKPLNPFFIKYYLDYAYSIGEFNEMQSHTTNLRNLRVNEFLSKTLIPIPPLPEQQRIVAKLDELMAKIDRSRARLERIPQILKRFRQSVLSAAVTGKLTEEWRDNGIEIERTLLGKLLDDLKYGTSQKSEKKEKGTPILRIPNIGDGVIVQDDLKYSELTKNEYERLKLVPGDILLIRSNGSVSLVGKAAIVSEQESGFAYAGYLIRLRCNKEKILPEFLNLALASFDLRLQIELPARSTSGVNNINSEEVRALIVPTPSIEEQKEIVRSVENLFGIANKIESRYNKAKAQLDKLPQSLLAKAFRGELVPQDENDEPASTLLGRIRRERGNDKKIKKSTKDEKQFSIAAEP